MVVAFSLPDNQHGKEHGWTDVSILIQGHGSVEESSPSD